MSYIAYLEKDTILHKINPIIKLIFTILVLVIVFMSNFAEDILILIIWLVTSIILWRLGGISIRYFSRILKILAGLAIFIILVQGFMYRGHTPLFVIGHLKIWGGADLGVFTYEGLIFGIMIVVRVITAVVAVPILVMTTSYSKLMESLTKLKIPYTYSFMLVTAMRFVPLIQKTWDTIVDAQKLRAFDFDKMNMFKKAFRGYIPITTPLVLLLFRKANDLQIAIETRGFGAPIKRTFIEDVEFHLRDYIMLATMIMLFIVSIIIKMYYEHQIITFLVSLFEGLI